jgi:hypothetical protein
MAGFAALIGGAGQAAGQYGIQQRQLLEERRNSIANLIATHVLPELSGTNRDDMMANLGRLYSNEPMGGVLKDVVKGLQAHQKDTQALHEAGQGFAQLIGPQPQQPKPPAGPAAPGSQPGTAPAAQPPTSPVSPQAQQNATPTNFTPLPAPPQAPAPQAAPPALPPVGQAQSPLMSLEDETRMMSSMPSAVRGSMASEVAQEAQTRRAIQLRDEGIAKFNSILADPNFMPGDPMRAAAASALVGHPLSMYGISSMATPIEAPGLIHGSDIGEGKTDILGNPIDKNGLYRAQQDKLTHRIIGYIPNAPTAGTAFDENGQQIATSRYLTPGTATGGVAPLGTGFDLQGNQILTPKYGEAGQATGAVGGPAVQQHLITLPSGQEAFQTPRAASLLRGPIVSGGINEAMQPRTTTGPHLIQTIGPNGPQTTVVNLPSTRTVGGAGGAGGVAPGPVPGPGGAPLSFEKPLTPEQTVKSDQLLNQYGTALNNAHIVLNNSHLLDSMLESGKLQIGLDSTTGALLPAVASRLFKYTPAEASVVRAMNSLIESVNLLRGPLGATGFRGPEAFHALQAQRGNLLANPQLTKGVLQQFIQEITNQYDPLARKLKKPEVGGGAAAQGTPEGVTHVFNSKTGQIEEVKK